MKAKAAKTPKREAIKTLAEQHRERVKIEASEPAPPKRDKRVNLKPAWQPGESGNPKGRPKGGRNKLSEAFLADLCKAWEDYGVEAIKTVAATDPASFLRVIASLVPKEVTGEGGGPLKLLLIRGDDAL